jgi:alpha-beta hydrolase superfamily lysophospholipase
MWMGIERGFNGFKHRVPDYAKNVHCPVLVQWGEKDSYVSREEVNRVFENLASPQKKMVVYPGADHESFLSVDPIAWQNQVQSFIKSLH